MENSCTTENARLLVLRAHVRGSESWMRVGLTCVDLQFIELCKLCSEL